MKFDDLLSSLGARRVRHGEYKLAAMTLDELKSRVGDCDMSVSSRGFIIFCRCEDGKVIVLGPVAEDGKALTDLEALAAKTSADRDRKRFQEP